MNWTTTPPTKPGAYWFNQGTSPSLCEVAISCGVLVARCCDTDFIKVEKWNGEWCGPLVPVEEVERAYREGFQDRNALPNQQFEDEAYGHSRARRVVEGEET